jgi:hypothetical protein
MTVIKSNQVVTEYQEAESLISFKGVNGVEDYMGLKSDINSLLTLINSETFTPQFGIGNPESVVTSNYSKTYFDTTSSPTSVTMYVNENVNVNTGWVPVV